MERGTHGKRWVRFHHLASAASLTAGCIGLAGCPAWSPLPPDLGPLACSAGAGLLGLAAIVEIKVKRRSPAWLLPPVLGLALSLAGIVAKAVG